MIILAEIICFAMRIKLFVDFGKFFPIKSTSRTITKKTLEINKYVDEHTFYLTNRMPFSNFYE